MGLLHLGHRLAPLGFLGRQPTQPLVRSHCVVELRELIKCGLQRRRCVLKHSRRSSPFKVAHSRAHAPVMPGRLPTELFLGIISTCGAMNFQACLSNNQISAASDAHLIASVFRPVRTDLLPSYLRCHFRFH
jgi:hypothetical protein